MSTAVAPAACFGQVESEPHHRALLTGTGILTLRPERKHEPAGPVESDVRNWCGDASATERSLLQSLRGPVLDIGCRPGRLLAAAGPLGLAALGIDTSAQAVRLAGAARCPRPRTVNFRPGTADPPLAVCSPARWQHRNRGKLDRPAGPVPAAHCPVGDAAGGNKAMDARSRACAADFTGGHFSSFG